MSNLSSAQQIEEKYIFEPRVGVLEPFQAFRRGDSGYRAGNPSRCPGVGVVAAGCCAFISARPERAITADLFRTEYRIALCTASKKTASPNP